MSVKISELPVLTNVLQNETSLLSSQSGVSYQTSPRSVQAEGWGNYTDATYTSISKLAVNNARVKVTIDGAGGATDTSFLPSGVTDLWDAVTNKITPENSGDCYDIRFSFKVEAAAQDALFDWELDIGGGIGVVASRTLTVPKAAGVPVAYSVGIPIFTLATFVSNGGEMYINTTPSGDNISVYDMALFIKRDFAAV